MSQARVFHGDERHESTTHNALEKACYRHGGSGEVEARRGEWSVVPAIEREGRQEERLI